MLIVPAIDLIEGKCVRLEQGDYHRKTVYSEDPLAVAQRFVDQGAELIHLVDLDGARLGRPANLEVVAQIAAQLPVPVELGGGIRSLEAVRQVRAAGVTRVILGTSALARPAWLKTAVKELGENLVVGIDARNGQVAVQGWLETSAVSALELAKQMKEIGVQEIIYTDIARDGMLQGPNIAALQEMTAAGLKIVASGGVSSLEDIRRLRDLPSPYIYACIVGKALYTGDLDLAQAISVAKGED